MKNLHVSIEVRGALSLSPVLSSVTATLCPISLYTYRCHVAQRDWSGNASTPLPPHYYPD